MLLFLYVCLYVFAIQEFTHENVEHAEHETDSYMGGFEANNGQQPYIGMKFESNKNVGLSYACYAKSVGFGGSIEQLSFKD